ncbi:MAG: glycosyltransferase family 4 protein [Pirellulales bacterium]
MPGPLPRIVVDLEKLRHINCGLGRFSLHLGESLLAEAPGRFEPVFFLPHAAVRHFPQGGFDVIAMQPWRKESVVGLARPLLRPFLGAPTVDLWHSTNQMSKYLPLDERVPVVLTIHDLAFLHEPAQAGHDRRIERKLADIQTRIDRACAVVTDTHYVADDVKAHLRLGDRPVHVVHLGLPTPPTPAAMRPGFVPDGPFLLTVGNCLAHKNFHVLLELLERLPERRLVIAGKKATPYGEFLEREIARRGLEPRAIMPGEVSDADRQWLYEHCEGFLFPSLSEGFGFPVLEAMQAGAPVFVARSTCLPEITGDHGFYLDRFDAEAMAGVYRAGVDTHRRSTGFADRARAHAAGYSWAATARGYVQVYEAILRGTNRPRRA